MPLSVFQNCKKIQNLTNDLKIIEFAVSSSKLLEVSSSITAYLCKLKISVHISCLVCSLVFLFMIFGVAKMLNCMIRAVLITGNVWLACLTVD